jgi:hypothetical protein
MNKPEDKLQKVLLLYADGVKARLKQENDPVSFTFEEAEQAILSIINEAREAEHDWLFDRFGDTDVSLRDWEMLRSEADARLNQLNTMKGKGI